MMIQTRTLLPWLVVAFVGLAYRPAHTQNIELIPPDNLTACGQATWQLTVSNTSTTPLTNLELAVLFTTTTGSNCDISYVAGSVAGAAEADLSHPSMPVFALPDLPVGGSVHLTLDAAAGCGLYDCINSGELFATQATLTYDGGTTTATTPPFNAFTPLLVITQVAPTVAIATAADTIVRTITIRNTREGSLSEFLFTDYHPPDPLASANPASIHVDQGEILAQDDELLVLRLGAADFAQIGNGDAYFDKDEIIVITEKISLSDCDIQLPASFVSQISVQWGCDSTYCQESEVTAVVRFDPATAPPPFQVEWEADSLICSCEPAIVRAYLTNTTDREAENLFAVLAAEGYPAYGIDSASIVARIDGDTIAWNATWSNPSSIPSEACLAELAHMKAYGLLSFPGQVLPPGSTLELAWATRSCTELCDLPEINWTLEWQYDTRCFKNVQGEATFTQPSLAPRPFATSLVTVDSFLTPLDTSFVLHLSFPTWQPAADTGSALQILLSIQPPLQWADTNSWALSGVLPDSLEWLDPDSTMLLLSYPWPLPTDTAHLYWALRAICKTPCLPYIPLTQCDLVYCTSTLATGILYDKVSSTVYLPLDDCSLSCRPKSCDSLLVSNLCLTNVQYDTIRIGAFVDYSFTTLRTNLGLRDDDDDRIADSNEPANPLLVARHHALPGDTLLSRMEGLVVVDSPGIQPNAIHLAVQLQYPGLGSTSEIQPLHNALSIFDANTGALYILEDLPLQNQLTNTGWEVFGQFSAAELASLGYDIPPEFLFEQDDEIVFQIEWKIGNIGQPNSELLVRFSPTLKIFESDGWQGINCGKCLQAELYVAVPEFSLLPGLFPLPPCDTSDYVGGTLVKVELPTPNFFPYEVRPLANLHALQMTLPAEVQLVEGKVTLYQLQNGPLLAAQIPLPVVPGTPAQYFDMEALLPTLIPDEGWFALLQYRFVAECDVDMPLQLTQTAHIDWATPLPQAGPESFDYSSSSLRPLHPTLILTHAPLSSPQTSEVQQLFLLINQSSVVGSVSSGIAPNAFFYADEEVFANCQLWRMPDSIPIPQTNGIFQIGDIAPGDTVAILLQCGYDVCHTTTALLSYGWSCTPLQSKVQAPCFRKESPLLLDPVLGEIEMSVPQTPAALALCADSGPFELTFYNAEKGRLYEPVLQLFLPQGLSFSAGSAEVQWPCPGGSWMPLPDPVEVAPGLLEWGPDAWPTPLLAEGIGGITEEPRNKVCIRFNGTTSCELASPDYFIASITATQGCGTPANLVTRISDTLQIEGAGTAPYQATLHANYTLLPDACGDTIELSISIAPETDLPPGTTLALTLPQGLTWLPGSCTPISIIADCTPSIDSHLLKWSLPAIAQGEVAAMSFQLAGLSMLDCTPQHLRWQLLTEGGSLFCADTGDSCQIQLSAGSLIQPLQLMRPEYRIAHFSAAIVPAGPNDHLAWNATIYNDGTPAAGTFTASLYLDNGNGLLDAGDQLLQQVSAATPASGTSVTLSGNAVLPADQWCNLLLVVPAAGECSCTSDMATLSSPVEVLIPDTLFACPDLPIPIGPADPGALGWQWQPTTGIACPSCPATTLTLPNDLSAPAVHEYILHAQLTATCFAEYRFTVVVNEGGGLLAPTSDLCEGQQLVLIASEGVNYQWSGPGVSDTSRILVLAQPQSGTYYLTMTDSSGCVFTDSIAVNIWPNPIADAGGHYSFCPEDEAVLQAAFVPGYTYEWNPALPWLDDPLSPSPHILIRTDQTYVLQVTNSYGCIDTDTAQVSFGESPELLPPAEVILCDTGTVTLTAEGASWYEWNPAGDCLDPACSTVQYVLSENQIVVLTGYSSEGCPATALVEMRIAKDTIFTTTDTLLLCAGDTLQIFPGEPPVTEPGLYCHTFQATGGCDSIACVPVALVPPADTGWVSTPPQCPGTTLDFFGNPIEEEGIHCVLLSSTAGCDSLLCTELTWLPLPSLEVSPQTATLAPGEEILLQATTDADSLWWTPATGLSCTSCPDPVASPESSTTYTVTALGDNGCTISAQVDIDVSNICAADSIQLPNFFTPNGDGINDTFGPVRSKNQVGAVFSLEIRNRWGQRIFTKQGTDVSWDGTWMGQLQPSDVYFFVLEVRCPDNQATWKGEITLMR